jgi:hypothetical protein
MHFGAFAKLFSQRYAAAGTRPKERCPDATKAAARLPRAGAAAAFTHFV